jgi:hypothetical protein
MAALPEAPAPALVIGRPRTLSPDRHLYRWTVVVHPAVARLEPDASTAVIARLSTAAPEGTANVVGVLRTRVGERGRVWVELRLPVLPNGTRGWVPRRTLGAYELVRTHLVVDKRALTATLYRAGKRIFAARVGIGTAAWPTPAGEFTIKSKLTSYRSPFYGPVAFGTTARSAVLTEWPQGGFVGIHGTDDPQLLPAQISHGCIRMRNRDILQLARLLPIGTPLTIR